MIDRRRLTWWVVLMFLLFASLCGPIRAQSLSPADVDAALRHATEAISVEPHLEAEYDYIMTARVRLLLFWVGKDDVGGGYIRRGTLPGSSPAEVIQLLMGSDPTKAPRAINRWGAATEIVQGSSEGNSEGNASTFLGFMKVSKGMTVSEMQKELAREKQGAEFQFSAIINQASRRGSVAKVVPFASNQDFTIHQLDQAEQVVYQHLADSTGRVRVIDSKELDSCVQTGGFLSSVSGLIDASLAGRPTPISLCYTYNGELYTLTLGGVTKLVRQTIRLNLKEEPHRYERSYENLLRTRFTNFNRTTSKSGEFELLLGTTGTLRGVPVQITYEPNWWFDVILNLKTLATPEPAPRP